jgi:hypothetical protein
MMQNPQQALQKMGIPQEHMESPQKCARYLLDSGKVTQQQINQVNNIYSRMFKK